MLFGLGQAGEIYAEIVSDSAKWILTDTGIHFSFGSSIPYIKNRIGDGMCTMEGLFLCELVLWRMNNFTEESERNE